MQTETIHTHRPLLPGETAIPADRNRHLIATLTEPGELPQSLEFPIWYVWEPAPNTSPCGWFIATFQTEEQALAWTNHAPIGTKIVAAAAVVVGNPEVITEKTKPALPTWLRRADIQRMPRRALADLIKQQHWEIDPEQSLRQIREAILRELGIVSSRRTADEN